MERKESRECQRCIEIEQSTDKRIKYLESKLEESIRDLKSSRECVRILGEKLQLSAQQLLDNTIEMTDKSSSLQIGESVLETIRASSSYSYLMYLSIPYSETFALSS